MLTAYWHLIGIKNSVSVPLPSWRLKISAGVEKCRLVYLPKFLPPSPPENNSRTTTLYFCWVLQSSRDIARPKVPADHYHMPRELRCRPIKVSCCFFFLFQVVSLQLASGPSWSSPNGFKNCFRNASINCGKTRSDNRFTLVQMNIARSENHD